MKPAGALLLLVAALLLISAGNGEKQCQPVKDDVNLLLTGSTEDYVCYVKKYNSNPAVLANAKNLKECVDNKLTAEDKQYALDGLEKIYTSPMC